MHNNLTLEQFAYDHGYTLPKSLPVERWLRIPAKNKSHPNKSASIRIFSDGNALIKDFTTGENLVYCHSSKSLTDEERQLLKKKVIAQKKQELVEYKKLVLQSSKFAKAIYSYGINPPKDFRYLSKKSIRSHGIKFLSKNSNLPDNLKELFPYFLNQDLLMIPRYSTEDYLFGDIQAIEFINSDGVKRPPLKSKPKATYFPMWGNKLEIVICEGFATGATLKEHYAKSKTVIVAFNADNLLHVAKYFRKICPKAEITIAGDNDHHNVVNTGKSKAIATARLIGASYSIPEFLDEEDGSDWNDRFLLDQKEASYVR